MPSSNVQHEAAAARADTRGHLVMILALILPTVLLAGCMGTSGGSGPPAPPEKATIVVGAVPATDAAGLYIALQRGFFAAAGLHVKIVNIISAEDAINDQLAGKFDVTLGNYVSYIEADAEHHADLSIAAEGSTIQAGNQAIVTPVGSRITTVAGLRGATLAVNVPNNVGTILVGSALAVAGLSLKDVKFVSIPFPFMTAALKDHKVEAAWVPEPFLSAAEEQIGAQEVVDLDVGSTVSFPIVGYAVTRTWEQKYPRTAAAFVRALEEGQALANSDRHAVEQAVEQFIGVPPITAAVMALPEFPIGVDRVRIQRVADAMVRFGLLKHRFDVSPMIG